MFTVRLIEPRDDAVIEKIIRSCLLEYGGNRPGTAWYDEGLAHFSEVYKAEGSRYWVCEEESGRVVGGVGIGGFPEREGVCELQKMYCIPEVRGKGAAHLLMREALAYASERYSLIFLDTFSNMLAARRFYEKYGFRESDTHPVDTGHFGCDVLMTLQLKK